MKTQPLLTGELLPAGKKYGRTMKRELKKKKYEKNQNFLEKSLTFFRSLL